MSPDPSHRSQNQGASRRWVLGTLAGVAAAGALLGRLVVVNQADSSSRKIGSSIVSSAYCVPFSACLGWTPRRHGTD